MSATRTQRIGIWIIAIFMFVGTIGSFIAIVLANSNQQTSQSRINELTAQYQADTAAQAAQLSEQYFDTFNQFASRPAPFDAASVTDLQKNDLVVGTGDTLTSDSPFTAYYIGWNPSGKVFDGSIEGNALKAPILVQPGGVIEGWTEGVEGMKIGGVRELTIPASLAYGETARSEDIPANTPLKFLIMVIPTPEAIEMPQELVDYYQAGRL